MSLTLFTGKNYKGTRERIDKNFGDLKVTSIDYDARSLKLSSHSDRVLLFGKTNYRGSVTLMRGARNVPDLRKTFGKLRATRIDPFVLKLHVIVVRKGDNYPGSWSSRADAQRSIDAAIAIANQIWSQAMIRFERGAIDVQESLQKFNVRPPLPAIPPRWKRPGQVDVAFVDSIGTGSRGGMAHPPVWGASVFVARRVGLHKPDIPDDLMGYVLAHELGHYMGIGHGSADGRRTNLMFKDAPASFDPRRVQLSLRQVEKVHGVLAGNLARKRDRRSG